MTFKKNQGAIGVFLLAFVDDAIYLNSSHRGRQAVLDVTSGLCLLLGFERHGGKCFSAEIDPEGGRTPNYPGRNRTSAPLATASLGEHRQL